MQRDIVDPKTLENASNAPAPGHYEKIDGFDGKWRETDFGTRQFKDDAQRKIVPVNLYNPHAVPETEKNKIPGPQHYKVSRLYDVPEQPEGEEYEPRLNVIPGGKVYVEQNMDRFGLPIRPMKPLNIIPGPGEYEVSKPRPGEHEIDVIDPIYGFPTKKAVF